MKSTLDDLISAHNLLLKVTEGIPENKYYEIPKGFRNHIYWNLGHVSATLALLTYPLCDQPLPLQESFIVAFRKGTAPDTWVETFIKPTIEELRKILNDLPMKVRADAMKCEFTKFKPYVTGAGVPLNNIEDAIRFCFFHAGLHIGYVNAQKKVLGCN